MGGKKRKHRCVIVIVLAGFSSASYAQRNTGGGNFVFSGLELDLRGRLTQAYDSNIALSSQDAVADFITTARLTLGGFLDLTEINSLNLTIGTEYRRYWNHPENSTENNNLVLTPETELEFLIQLGNFDFRIYDQFSMASDPGDQRFVDSSTGNELVNIVLYNRINNRGGIEGIWTINSYWSANAGISRRDVIPLETEFDDLQRHTYSAHLGISHNFAANLDLNGRVSWSRSQWETGFQPDSSSWSLGGGASWQPSNFLETDVFLSWTNRSFGSGSLNQDPTTKSQGLTGNFSVTHFLNQNLQHSIFYTRSIDLGTISNGVTSQSAEYQIDYTGIGRSTLFLSLFWSEGAESGQINPEEFNRWSAIFGLDYPLSRGMNFSIDYEHTLRDSSVSSRSYTRDRLSLSIDYDF